MTREELNKKKQKKISREVRLNKNKKIINIAFKVFFIIFIFVSLFYLFNKYISTKQIIFKEKRIVNGKLPTSFNGLKIIHFSDLHYGTTMFISEIEEIVKSINERKPDLVVFTGDLIDKNYKLEVKEQELLIKQLSKISANIGKYAIMGEEDDERFSTIFNQSDFTILNNDYDLIYNESSSPILIVGVSSTISKNDDINKAFSYFNKETYNSNIYTIALLHEPDLVDKISSNYDVDLYLAGHSHNNSINYPWGGSPYKINGALKYNEEYYEIGKAKLFISSGIGTNGNGIRLWCLPSINFFRLSNE